MFLKNNNAYIITGAPGTGKTTLIEKLEEKFSIVNEPAREIINEQKLSAGSGLWEQDRELFTQLLQERSISNFENSKKDIITFFDRGVPDVSAYADFGGVKLDMIERNIEKYQYNHKVFLLGPWQDIYVKDDERSMDFESIVEFDRLLRSAYKGYDIIEVPKVSTEMRVSFILEHIACR